MEKPILDMLAANGTAIRDIERQLAALDDTIAIYERLLREAKELRHKVANQTLPLPQEGDRFHSVVPAEDGTLSIIEVTMASWGGLPQDKESGKTKASDAPPLSAEEKRMAKMALDAHKGGK